MDEVVVSPSGISFISYFMKISHLAQEVKGADTHTQHGNLIGIFFFLKKRK
jgi:hypothetical protein